MSLMGGGAGLLDMPSYPPLSYPVYFLCCNQCIIKLVSRVSYGQRTPLPHPGDLGDCWETYILRTYKSYLKDCSIVIISGEMVMGKYRKIKGRKNRKSLYLHNCIMEKAIINFKP